MGWWRRAKFSFLWPKKAAIETASIDSLSTRSMTLILRQRTRSTTICMIDIASKDAEYNDMHD
jgi:hypothetical protein